MSAFPSVLSPARKTASCANRLVLLGNPNAGKTTLFNRITGLRAKTSNYPGTTVEIRRARIRRQNHSIEIVDLPGIYGLGTESPDERVASEFLEASLSDPMVATTVVVVVDSTQLERGLYLAAQVRERADSLLIALNMSDIADRDGIRIDCDKLAFELEAPVVRLSARTGLGFSCLLNVVDDTLLGTPKADIRCERRSELCEACGGCPHAARFQWSEQVCSRVRQDAGKRATQHRTAAIDRWCAHPTWGLLIFGVVTAAYFQAIFWLAETPMAWVDGIFASLGNVAASLIPDGWVQSFVVDGIIAGLGGTVIFIPQICILFFLLSLLEDTGYLARAAFVIDRSMSLVGLPGKAFVPMLSAHACAIPAIMSTRTIGNEKDRLITIMVIPLLTCAARIPVYVMVTAMLFHNRPLIAGSVFAGAYLFGLIAAFASAFLFRRTVIKGRAAPLLIELPTYKIPSFRTAFLTMIDRGWIFLRRAGTVILGISILLWALASFPALPEADQRDSHTTLVTDAPAPTETTSRDENNVQLQLEHSIVGRIGKAIQPVFEPLGFDWKITVGVLTSFAAREVIASTLSILYGLGETGIDDPSGIASRLRTNLHPGTGLSLLVFFILAMQCLPTQVVARRETGSWKWPLIQFGYMSILAYSAAFVTFQIASRLLS